MAMAEALPPDASTASTGLGLRYIGNYAYAFSGLIEPQNNFSSPLTMLEFTTDAGAYITEFNFSYQTSDLPSNQVIYFRLTLNDVVVFQLTDYTNAAHTEALMAVQQKIILPPHTKVLVNAGNNYSGAIDTYATLFGERFYGTA